mmetsp:Transcript_21035/g.48585  ORF Transcript_21035/g.48585 Transcript_21035/m.48585 type:complete len:260 (+) Transcript_21035:306-1085(+)
MISKYQRLADTSYFNIVFTRCIQWHGILKRLWIIHQYNTRCFRQDLFRQLHIHGFFRFHHDGFRMSTNRGNPNGCATKTSLRKRGVPKQWDLGPGGIRHKKQKGSPDWEVFGQSANFSRFPSDFHFFLGVSIFLKFVNVWNDIKGKWMSEDFVFGRSSIQHNPGTSLEFVHSRLSGTRCSLVGAHKNLFQSKCLVQRPKGHETDGRRTIGIGDELGTLGTLSVDLRYHQGNVVLVTKRRRVVNHNGTIFSLRNCFSMFQ